MPAREPVAHLRPDVRHTTLDWLMEKIKFELPTRPTWLTYLMLVLASFRLAHLVVYDRISEFIRNPFLREETVTDEDGRTRTEKVPANKVGYMLTCYWCAGVWSSVIVGAMYILSPRWGRRGILVLSIAGAQSLLEAVVRLAIQTRQFLGRKTEDA